MKMERGREPTKDRDYAASDCTVVWPNHWGTIIPGEPIGTRTLNRA